MATRVTSCFAFRLLESFMFGRIYQLKSGSYHPRMRPDIQSEDVYFRSWVVGVGNIWKYF